MGFWSKFAGLATGGLFGSTLFGSSGKKKDPYADLMAQLSPLIKQNQEISATAGKEGLANISAAREDYDYVSDFLKNILEGSDDNLLKMLDASGITAAYDENAQQASELAPRGGMRAAVIGNSAFDRSAELNRTLQGLRFAAPGQLAQIAQAIGNLGLGELSASTGAGAQASNVIFGVEQLKDADADRRAAMIGSIFSAIGATAGALACVAVQGSHIYVPSGRISAQLINVGDEVLSFDKVTREQIVRRVVRKRITPNQTTKIITNGNTIIRATPSHQFYDMEFNRISCEAIEAGDLLTVYWNGVTKKLQNKDVIIMGKEQNDVMIIKLDDEKECYPFIVNGYLSEDDDPMTVVE